MLKNKTARKFTSLIISITMVSALFGVNLLGTVGESYGASVYTDTKGHYAADRIDKWSTTNVIRGNNGKFRPDDPVTRAELSSILNNVMKYQITANNSFTDLKTTHWGYDPILKANAAGIILGSNNKVRPDDKITRQEAAIMFSRAFALAPVSGVPSFPDTPYIESWAVEYINAMVNAKFMTGRSNGKFDPRGKFTRAEAIVILDNAIKGFYNSPGTYSADSSGMVVVNTQNIILSNMNINGNLIIAEGVGAGDFTLNNVRVFGTTFVKGGGPNSININGTSRLSTVKAEKEDSVSIAFKIAETAQVDQLDVTVGNVSVSGPLKRLDLTASSTVSLKGASVTTVNLDGSRGTVNGDSSSTVTTLNLPSKALNASVTGNMKVTTIYSQAPVTSTISCVADEIILSGSGASTIKGTVAKITANGSSQVNIGAGASVTAVVNNSSKPIVIDKSVTLPTVSGSGSQEVVDPSGNTAVNTGSVTVKEIRVTDNRTILVTLSAVQSISYEDIKLETNTSGSTWTTITAAAVSNRDNFTVTGSNTSWKLNLGANVALTEGNKVRVAGKGLLKSGTVTGSYDLTAPTVTGGTTITSSSAALTSTRIGLSWNKATDNYSAAADLRYYIYRSTSNNISSLANCLANGTLANKDGTLNISSYEMTGLTANTLYYFNVVVADENGNKTAYSSGSQTTGVAAAFNATVNLRVDGSAVNANTVKYGVSTATTLMTLGSTGTYTSANVPAGTYKVFVDDKDSGVTFNSAIAVTVDMYKVNFTVAANVGTGGSAGTVSAKIKDTTQTFATGTPVFKGTKVIFSVARTVPSNIVAWSGGVSGSGETAELTYNSAIAGPITCTLTGQVMPTVTTISAVTISITPPVSGGALQTTISSTDEYNGTIAWSPSEPILSGSKYTAIVTLTAKSAYKWADTVIVTGVSVTTATTSSDKLTLTITAEFIASDPTP